MIRASITLILASTLCGCQRYADLAGPVEMPTREVVGPGICVSKLEWPDQYDAADSSQTCWDGSRPHMVEFSRPRIQGRTCGESLWMPEGQVKRRFGCPKPTEHVEL